MEDVGLAEQSYHKLAAFCLPRLGCLADCEKEDGAVCNAPFALLLLVEIISEKTPAVLIIVAIDAEVLPVRAVRRVVVGVPVFVVHGQEVPVLEVELTTALRTDEAVNLQGLLPVAPFGRLSRLFYYLLDGFCALAGTNP